MRADRSIASEWRGAGDLDIPQPTVPIAIAVRREKVGNRPTARQVRLSTMQPSDFESSSP